jgi:hypothetical protein
MEPGRQCLKRILRRGIERKLLPSALDLDDAMALLLGPLLYMKIFHNGACSEDIGAKVAAAFWRAHSIAASTPAPAKARRSHAK